MASCKCSLLAAATITWALLLVCCPRVNAHGGKLHRGTPETSNYIRTKVATCSKWLSNKDAAQFLVDRDAKPQGPVDVKGTVTLWQYLYGNCSLAPGAAPSAGAAFNVTVTRGGAPLSGAAVTGMAVTGPCASGGGAPFYFNASAQPLDDPENFLGFYNHTIKADGRIAGIGANDGTILTAGKAPVKAIMLSDAASGTALACCDLVLAGPASTSWTASLAGKGSACPQEEEEETAHGAMYGAAGGHDHAGHDHAGHDHAAMNVTSSGGGSAAVAGGKGSAAPAKSTGGAAAPSAAAAAAAVLLGALLL